MDKIIFEIEKNNKIDTMPFYASEGDAGMDVCALEDVLIAPGEKVLIRTGIKINIPREDLEIQVRPRSGLSLKTNLSISNAPGTIDYGYMDEIKIIVKNESLPFNTEIVGDEVKLTPVKKEDALGIDHKGSPNTYIQIKKGDRIAQFVFSQLIRAELKEVNVLSDKFDRGGGFGHTGTRK